MANDIAELRARFPETRALYREVCGLLFFRYGVTPTATSSTAWCARAAWARHLKCCRRSDRSCAGAPASPSTIPICRMP